MSSTARGLVFALLLSIVLWILIVAVLIAVL